ncbi:MAG: flagellar motor protein MotB [Planctomycetota bacterium]|jgi:chemotaxis protein MotB
MSGKRKAQPITVVEGAPEWMVTFGDMMSLLLCFFVLLFSISEIKSEKLFDVVFAVQTESDADELSLIDLDDAVTMLSSLSEISATSTSEQEGRMEQPISNPFGEFASVHRVKDDLHIDIEGDVAFEPGSAELSAEGREVIRSVSRRLRGGWNRVRVVGVASRIEGEGDESRLAYERCRAVGDVLTEPSPEEEGIHHLRLELATRWNDPLRYEELTDIERLRKRDRVVIVLTPEPVQELVDREAEKTE